MPCRITRDGNGPHVIASAFFMVPSLTAETILRNAATGNIG
jgi:hypothetical protein